ncbi:MAG: CpsB/CapC family capsule biosynthesis tyrosine phosphatase [Oscillospiraceae bacterium]
MRIDFHSHILPVMDDGAKNTEESLQLLEMLHSSRVDMAVLTSHFYRQKENIDSFIGRREMSFGTLKRAMGESGSYPGCLLGAEIYFYPSLSSDPDFGRLCMENTDYILLELPFERFQDNFYRNFSKFVNNCDHKIILAHIERYLSFGNTVDDIFRLCEYGDFVFQINCTSIAEAGFMQKRKLSKIISSGVPIVLGTDAHNTSARPPMFDKAEKCIIKQFGQGVFDRICRNSELIIENCELSKLR